MPIRAGRSGGRETGSESAVRAARIPLETANTSGPSHVKHGALEVGDRHRGFGHPLYVRHAACYRYEEAFLAWSRMRRPPADFVELTFCIIVTSSPGN
jgi:hypothetical protein